MTRIVKWLSGCLCLLLMAAMLFSNPNIAYAASDGGILLGVFGYSYNDDDKDEPDDPVIEEDDEIPDYNYALRVTTGFNDGSHIGGFFIRYKDDQGNDCSEFIDPHDGILSESVNAANKAGKRSGSTAKEKITYLNVFGYDISAFSGESNLEALSSNSTNTFMLKFENEIDSITEIDILTDIGVNGGIKAWSLGSMELYEMTSLNGFDMNGYYSKDYNVDFNGKIIARVEPPKGSSTYQVQNDKKGMDSIVKAKSGNRANELQLVTGSDLGPATEGSYKTVYVEIALADIAGAGIESFINSVDDKKTVADMCLPECMTLKMSYYDTFNGVRTVTVPVITSALGYAMERGAIGGNTTLAEFLGQGQNLLLKLKLYNFKSFVGGERPDFELVYDPVNAAASVGFQELSDAQGTHSEIASKMVSESDDISILGIYVYDGDNAEVEKALNHELENDTILKISGERSSRTGYMTHYISAPNIDGISVPVSNKGAIQSFTLKKYTEGAVIEPVGVGDNYLVRIRTFPADEAATTSPVSMRLKYTGTDNEEHETLFVSLEDAARTYYGSWPGSGNTDISYMYGMSAGQTLYCIMPIKDVKAFNSVTFTLKGQDTWQFEHIDIARINSKGIGNRHIEWLDSPATYGTVSTDRKVYRDIESQEMSMEEVLVSFDGTVFMNENSNVKTINFGDDGSEIIDDVVDNWREEYSKSMPYEVTKQNLGFTQVKETYDVTVVVGSDEVVSANGDCGSSNFFYFQLEFENGKSAYVQANQQLASDGFIEGTEATFTISTNYDLGNLTAVHVIPDDSSADANPYDKLKIDKIRVTRYDKNVNGKLYQWEMSTTPQNCWVGIDYQEEGEKSTNTKETRDIEAYKTTYTNFEYKSISQVLVAINTGTYDAGQLIATDMSAKLSGTRLDGTAFTQEIGDVLKKMYDFYGENPKDEDGKTVSDPSTMFRVGTWNYFLIGMENVRSIDNMTITYNGKEVGDWKIERVELYRVTKNNGVKISADNYYCLDGEMEQITQSQNSTPIRSEIIAPEYPVTVSVNFVPQDKPMEEADTEDFRVNRKPVSRNDYVNIVLYMDKNETEEAYNKYDVSGAVRYFSSADVIMQSSNIHFASKQENGETVFYANNIGVRDVCSINQLVLHADYPGPDAGTCKVDYAIVQRIRAGVVIETYRFNCGTNLSNATQSFSPVAGSESSSTGEYQMVSLAFGEGTSDMSQKGLNAEVDDVAVAIQYRSSIGDGNTVYQSPYIFLTDQQIMNIKAHTVCHLKFKENYVKEITGIVVASTGKTLETVVESACITTYVPDSTHPTWETLNRMSFKTDGFNCDAAYVVNGNNTLVKSGIKSFAAKKVEIGSVDAVYPISMVFTTGEAQEKLENIGDENVKISLEINYRSEDGTDYVHTIENIKDHLVSGGFGPNETAEIQFMGQDMANINYIVIKMDDGDDDTICRWDLRRVDFSYGDAANVKDYSVGTPVDTYVYEREIDATGGEITYKNEGLKLGVKNVMVVLAATSSNNAGGTSYVTTTSDAPGEIPELTIMNDSGVVTIKVDVLGRGAKKSVTVHAGVNSEDDSLDYARLNAETGTITFTPPTNKAARYTLQVVSDDNPQAVAKLIIVVPSKLESSGGGSNSGTSSNTTTDTTPAATDTTPAAQSDTAPAPTADTTPAAADTTADASQSTTDATGGTATDTTSGTTP